MSNPLPNPNLLLTGPLALGSRGDSVRNLQLRLNAIASRGGGGNLVADAAFGLKTDQAVRAFQRDGHLRADGVVGPRTAAAMGFLNYRHAPAPRGAPTPPRPLDLPPAPSGVPVPPRAPDDSPARALADQLYSVLVTLGNEVASLMLRAGRVFEEDVRAEVRAFQSAVSGAAGVIAQQLRSVGNDVAQVVRVLQAGAQTFARAIRSGLQAIGRVSMKFRVLAGAVETLVLRVIERVFSFALEVARGVGGTVQQFASRAFNTVYGALSQIVRLIEQYA